MIVRMAEPQNFGKYQLLRVLAQGGMAEVFLAKQVGPEGFEKVVVVKRVLPHLSRRPDFVEMFLDEARLNASLSHPNIVQVFDFGLAQGQYFLAMEYLAGEDLSTIYRQSVAAGITVPPEIVALVGAAACDALHYIHVAVAENGEPRRIVHRDISPSNLIVTYQGTVKILDFGIAKAEGKLVETQQGTLKGKYAYMSPEQALSEPLDGRSDLFSLGAVLYELLTGARLFQREGHLALLKAVTEETILPPSMRRPEVPQEMDAVVMRALARDKGERYQSAQEMRRDLDQFLAARTYVPAQSQLQQYLTQLFGEAHVRERSRLPTTGGAGTATVSSRPRPPQPQEAPLELDTKRAESRPRPQTTSSTGGRNRVMKRRPSGWTFPPLSWLFGAALLMLMLYAGINWVLSRIFEPSSGELAAATARARVPGPVAQPSKQATSPPLDLGPDKVEQSPEAPPGLMVRAPSESHRRTGGKHLIPVPIEKPPRGYGTLTVSCVPWCHIYVDGLDTGRNSPVSGMKLSAGRHELRVVNPPSGRTRDIDVEVENGGNSVQRIEFEKGTAALQKAP
jgi:eukaryotic-like serine/threonine-protein kinase